MSDEENKPEEQSKKRKRKERTFLVSPELARKLLDEGDERDDVASAIKKGRAGERSFAVVKVHSIHEVEQVTSSKWSEG